VQRRVAVGLAVFALLPLGGCGTGGTVEASSSGNGQQLFSDKCASCHTLADAGARGTIGPNLDDAFAVPIEEGFDESTILEVVLGQMRFPVEPMPQPDSPDMFPSSEYTDDEREAAMAAIAAYVASVAGRPPSGGGAAAGGGATTGDTTTGGTTTGGGQTTTGGTTTSGGAAAGDAQAKSLFTANCAACHTFAAAGSSGTVGPDLDQSTKNLAAIEQQIRRGGGGMPPFAGTLTDAQIKALAKWIAGNRKK
jgi:mono/diheme cytochrome c family protein